MSQDDSLSQFSNKPAITPLITGLDHCSLIVADTAKALEFYMGILALEVDSSRPDLGYPGAWLRVGNGQIHLLEVVNPYSSKDRTAHGGRDYHLAMNISDLQTVILRLQQAGIKYSKSKSGRAALFCRDFDGNTIELVETTA